MYDTIARRRLMRGTFTEPFGPISLFTSEVEMVELRESKSKLDLKQDFQQSCQQLFVLQLESRKATYIT
jgi:hypothetical protein